LPLSLPQLSLLLLPLLSTRFSLLSLFFFFNDTATTEIYTLSLHDALPIFAQPGVFPVKRQQLLVGSPLNDTATIKDENLVCVHRSEEHTSELQSLTNLVCRLLLEKKKQQ